MMLLAQIENLSVPKLQPALERKPYSLLTHIAFLTEIGIALF